MIQIRAAVKKLHNARCSTLLRRSQDTQVYRVGTAGPLLLRVCSHTPLGAILYTPAILCVGFVACQMQFRGTHADWGNRQRYRACGQRCACQYDTQCMEVVRCERRHACTRDSCEASHLSHTRTTKLCAHTSRKRNLISSPTQRRKQLVTVCVCACVRACVHRGVDQVEYEDIKVCRGSTDSTAHSTTHHSVSMRGHSGTDVDMHATFHPTVPKQDCHSIP